MIAAAGHIPDSFITAPRRLPHRSSLMHLIAARYTVFTIPIRLCAAQNRSATPSNHLPSPQATRLHCRQSPEKRPINTP